MRIALLKLLCVILAASASSHFTLDVPPGLASEISGQTNLRKSLTSSIKDVQDALDDLDMPKEQKENVARILKVYAKARAKLDYSPDLRTIEQSYVTCYLLKSLLQENFPFTQKSLEQDANSCGSYLGDASKYFERHFPTESLELREYLDNNKEHIEIIFPFINDDRDIQWQDRGLKNLKPQWAEVIKSKAEALKTKNAASFFYTHKIVHRYEHIFKEGGRSIQGIRNIDSLIRTFTYYAIIAFYKENFTTSREIYEALFGNEERLFNANGTPLWESSDLKKHLDGLCAERLDGVKIDSPIKDNSVLNHFKTQIFNLLKHNHKENGRVSMENLDKRIEAPKNISSAIPLTQQGKNTIPPRVVSNQSLHSTSSNAQIKLQSNSPKKEPAPSPRMPFRRPTKSTLPGPIEEITPQAEGGYTKAMVLSVSIISFLAFCLTVFTAIRRRRSLK
jgi:hypothetical protein